MCGIGGFVDFSRPGASFGAELAAMEARLRHRGPDAQEKVVLSHAALLSTRLALLDVAGGRQPWVSDDGRFTLIYNGEIWNHQELREELPARRYRSRSDTETLLEAWRFWGEACLPRLGGMFAFFLWDEERQEGLAARDLLGIKPFVFQRREHGLAFASEAKALLPLLPGRPRLRRRAILEYLAAPCFSGVETPVFQDLEYLPPGHLLHISRAGLVLRRWGHYDLGQSVEDDPALADALRLRLGRAAALAAQADAPLGIFLSGGLDSTGLAALVRRRAGLALPSFTVRFADQDSFDYRRSRIVGSDDSPFAAMAARQLELPHRFVDVARRTLAADLEQLARSNDALPAWEQELALHHLARAARDSCKGVLLGDAADETHWGYHFLLDDEAVAGPAAILRRFADPPLRRELAAERPELDRHYQELCRHAGFDFAEPAARRRATAHLIVVRWLPRLLHNSDIHTMAHGLEGRVPFGDGQLLALAARVHPALGLRGGVEKYLLRRALRPEVPAAIATRRKSALPKDQHTAATYRREAARQLADWPELFAAWLELPALAPLLDPRRVLEENERALLFRLICLGHFARHHGVLVE